MCDTYLYRQGFFFWVDDMNEETNTKVTFNNSVIPKKRRIWLIVSSNESNKSNSNVTVVPVYTRDEVTRNTQVAFKNGQRNCVICCEDIMTIPRAKITSSSYAGVCSPELWQKVYKAIISQFTNEYDGVTQNDVVSTPIVNKPTTTNITKEFSNTSVNSTINVDSVKPNNTTSRYTNKAHHRKCGKTMTDEVAAQYIKDASMLSLRALNAKYSEYCPKSNSTELQKKIRYLKKRAALTD